MDQGRLGESRGGSHPLEPLKPELSTGLMALERRSEIAKF